MPIFSKTKKAPPSGPTFARGGWQPADDAAKYVPSLAEADPETYGKLVAKIAELNGTLSSAYVEKRTAEKALAAHEGPSLRVGVAELLGDDSVAGRASKVAAVREARQRVADIEAAITIAQQRLRDAKTAATRAVIPKVKPEWDKRTKALCDALKAAQTAHIAFDELRQALEAEEVSADHLGQRPHFLGDARDGHISRFLKEAGYAN